MADRELQGRIDEERARVEQLENQLLSLEQASQEALAKERAERVARIVELKQEVGRGKPWTMNITKMIRFLAS